MKVNPNINPMSNNSWGADELNKPSTNKGGGGILEERSGLSVDDFLKIMAAEMQNQSPMGDDGGGGSKTDYISQLAQFTSLELMTDVVENLNYVNIMSQQQYAFTLIGKDVSLRVDGQDIVGSVEKVKFKDGFPTITVGGKDYELGNVMEVGEKGDLVGAQKPEDTDEDKEVDTEVDTDTEVQRRGNA